MPFLILCLALLLGLIAYVAWRHWRKRRRDAARAAPFPESWRKLLTRNVAIYRRLPPPLREQLHRHILAFLHVKSFHGCAGFEVTDEVRVTVAAQACLLLLNRESDYFPGFTSVLVYPDTYVARTLEDDGLIAGVAEDVRAGESWHRGPVVLSWRDVLLSAREDGDAFNVVIHEFAHKLDEENAVSAGLPLLDDPAHYAQWARVFGAEYEAMLASRGGTGVLDDYGATSPDEFFAVASETFFERPKALRAKHAELYATLARFYKVEPHTWAYDG